MSRLGFVVASLAAAWAAATPAIAQELSAKTITFLVGFGAGGGYDTYSRILARHWGKHLPGNPSIVVQNMPGGGSLIVANVIYNVAPKDGSQVGMMAGSAALEPLMGNAQAKFDTAKFTWIGNVNKDVSACGAWVTSGIKTWDDAVKRGARFGGVGQAAATSQHAAFLKNVLVPSFKVVTGFAGTNEVNLAMQRGEVDASCGLFLSSAKGPYGKDIASGSLKLIIQLGRKNEPFFGDAVNIYTLLKTPDEQAMADFVFGQVEIARPIAAPPGVPESIASTLRRGFDAVVRDPDLLADMQKAQLDVDSMSGVETAKAFATFAQTPKHLVERAKAAMVAGP